jgi:hypothetical protein
VDDRRSIPKRGKIFFSSVTASRPDSWLTPPSIQWEPGALSLGVKHPECEANHSPPPSAEVKNDVAVSPTLPYVFIAWCLINYAHRHLYLYQTFFGQALGVFLQRNSREHYITGNMTFCMWDSHNSDGMQGSVITKTSSTFRRKILPPFSGPNMPWTHTS